MTAMAEKLKNAGADTVGARLTTTCIEALRLYPDNPVKAWAHVGTAMGYNLLRVLAKDMGLTKIQTPQPVQPIKARVIPPERLERQRKLRDVVRSKYKNSAGVAWSEVGWHELTALSRDGVEARALLKAGPATVPNDGRTVGQVLGVKRTDQIIKTARS